MSIKKEHGVKTNLITREGYLQLQQEHTQIDRRVKFTSVKTIFRLIHQWRERC